MIKVNVAVFLFSLFAFFCIPQTCLPHLSRTTDKLLKHATRGTLTQQRWEKICTTSNVNEWEIVLRYLPDLLQAAIKAGQLVATQILLANCLYYSADFAPNELLKLAASQGHSHILVFLLSCFTYIQHDLDNALISACIENHHQAAELLLSHGADSNVKLTTGSSLLSIAACKGYKLTLEVLLNNGANPHQNNDLILRELLLEATTDHLLQGLQTLARWSKKPTVIPFSSDPSEIIRYYLDKPNCIPCTKQTYKKIVSLLELCEEIGQQRFSQEINLQFIEQTTTDAFTIEKLRSLVEQHADVHAFDDYALRNAVLQGNVRAVSVLLCINLIPTVPSFKEEVITELLEFCSHQIALRIIQFNAYIQIREKLAFYQNQQKFIDAVQNETITTAQQLQAFIDQGAEIHWNNEWALCLSVIRGNNHMISLLKRHRPDLTVNNNAPFHLAVSHGRQNLIPLLVNSSIAKKELEQAVHTNNIQILDSLISWSRERVPCPLHAEFIAALRICAQELEKHEIADRLQQLENYLLSIEIGAVSESVDIPTQTRITEETPLQPTASIEQELETHSEFIEINIFTVER